MTIRICSRYIRGRLGRFLRNSAGSVTMFTAFSALPAFIAVGAAIDYMSMTRDITSFQAAADSAVIAVVASDGASLTGLTGSALATRMDELEDIATKYIEANYRNATGKDTVFDANLEITGQKVLLTSTHYVPTTWLAAFGIVGPTATVVAEIKKAARPVELVMVMDTTGSMGTTYMAQARTAARNLMNKLYGGTKDVKTENPDIRVGLVPFSGAVRLNTSAFDFDQDWIDTTGASSVSRLNFTDSSWHNWKAWDELSGQTWNGCVEARPRGSAPNDYLTNDAPPVSGDTLFVPYFAPDEPTFSSSSSYGYYNSYVSTSGTPNENTGLSGSTGGFSYTSTSSSIRSISAIMTARQNNQAKYVNKSISSESSTDYGPWFNCAKSKIVPLTYKRANVETGIDLMTASGSTVIPEGLAWGWRALSPTEPFTKVEGSASYSADTISNYNDVRWRKVLVLMTDGQNDVLSGGSQVNTFNGTWYSAYGRGKATTGNRFGTTTSSGTGAALNEAMLTLCSNIKESGIEIYTIAFRVTDPTILDHLEECATDEYHYSFAADGVALGTIFNHIGENVTNASIFMSK